jgi:hypothetical protein
MATRKLKMTDKIELTIQELKKLFIAGENFESDTIAVNMGEKEEVDSLDFGEYLKETFDIEIGD